MIGRRTVLNTWNKMVKSDHSQYFMLLDVSWGRFNEAHPNINPAYCLVSEDVEDFLDGEQIGFMCPVVVDNDLQPKSICLIHDPL